MAKLELYVPDATEVTLKVTAIKIGDDSSLSPDNYTRGELSLALYAKEGQTFRLVLAHATIYCSEAFARQVKLGQEYVLALK